jgi:hypothetical protein
LALVASARSAWRIADGIGVAERSRKPNGFGRALSAIMRRSNRRAQIADRALRSDAPARVSWRAAAGAMLRG